MKPKLISIVSPCYNEEDNVEACYKAVKALFVDGPLNAYDYEHIFADNNSSDGTVEVLRNIAASDKRIKIIVNARNYGPFRSTFNALRYTKGDAVVPMFPVDLQDPPELIEEFVKYWEEGYVRVYGVRTDREEGLLLRFLRRRYYWAVNRFSDIDIPENAAEFQILDRKVVTALLRYRDYYPYIRGMIANIGFHQKSKAIPYTWKQRRSGLSKNRLPHLVDQALNGLISFSNFPVRLTMGMGFLIAGSSLVYSLVQLAINLIFGSSAPPGVPTLIIALFFLSGIQLALIGVVGEYVAAIHFQLRHGDILVEQEHINLSIEDKA